MNIPFWFHISFHVDSALHPNDGLCPPKMKNLIILLVRGSQENNESVYLYLYNAAGCFSFAQHITHETRWEVKRAKSPILAKQISQPFLFLFFLPSNILLKVCAGPRGDRRLLFKHHMMSKHFHSGGKKNSCSFICRADSILTTFPFHNRRFPGPQWNLLPFDGALLNRGLTSQSPVTVATHAWLMIYHTRHRTGLLRRVIVRKLRECKQVED